MQLLFEKSTEFGKNIGLGLVNGEVIKFNKKNKIQYVPYIGWNEIKLTKNKSKILESNLNLKFMYFVHSFYCNPLSNKIISATTRYGKLNYCSAISYQNIEAFQFHPEKSGKNGLNIYSKIKKIISK
jgi:glutamine amidotransferase